MKPTNTSASLPDLSLCIVNWNTGNLTVALIRSAFDTIKSHSFEIIVVDNASSDNSKQLILETFPHIQYIESTDNRGYAAGMNQAIRQAQGQMVMILNPDVVFLEGCVDEMAGYLANHSAVGAVGGYCLTGSYEPGLSYGFFPRVYVFLAEAILGKLARPILQKWPLAIAPSAKPTTPFSVEFIIGACILVKRDVLDVVGELDERFFAFFEETDWCLRIQKAGWECHLLPNAKLIHFGGQSFTQVSDGKLLRFYQSLYLYLEKHHGSLAKKVVWWSVTCANYRRLVLQKVRNLFRFGRFETPSDKFANQILGVHRKLHK